MTIISAISLAVYYLGVWGFVYCIYKGGIRIKCHTTYYDNVLNTFQNKNNQFFSQLNLYQVGSGLGDHIEIDNVKYWYQIYVDRNPKDAKNIDRIEIKLTRE